MGKQPEELAEFSDEEIAAACTKIAAHRKVGPLWHKPFNGQQKRAAISWLQYKNRYTQATLEQWFSQFDSSVLPHPAREQPWRI
jgi:hypothetical protein